MFPIIAKIAEVVKEVATTSVEEIHISEAVMQDMKDGLAQTREAEASMSNMSSIDGMKHLEPNTKYIKDGQLYSTDKEGIARLNKGDISTDFANEKVQKASQEVSNSNVESIREQDAAISRCEKKGLENCDSDLRGKYGEMKTDQDMRKKGFDRISNDMIRNEMSQLEQGIDGVFYREVGKPQYAIVESKFGSSTLRETVRDGMQMSSKWIDKRLDDAVGKTKADEIRMEQLLNPDNVINLEARVNYSGEVTYNLLDDAANVIERGIVL